MAEETDNKTKPAGGPTPEELAKAYAIPAVWCNRTSTTAITSPSGRFVRIAFGEGSSGPDTVTYRAAVMMTAEDAISIAEAILTTAGVRIERVLEGSPAERKEGPNG